MRLHVVGSAVMIMAMPLASGAQVVQGIAGAPPQIVTTGQGEVRVTPDRATIMIGVQTRASTAAEAASENARRQRAVIDTLEALGIPAREISTLGYNVYPEMRYDTVRQQQRITGYVVSNAVRTELHQVSMVGSAIDAALAKGANQINSLRFSSSTTDDARRMALSQAVAQARGDAEAIAKAAGGHVGEVVEITEVGGYTPPIMEPMMGARVAGAVAPTPIEPGELTVQVSVNARWSYVVGNK